MKKAVLAAAVASTVGLFAAGAAHAQSPGGNSIGVRPFLAGGLTAGGDRLDTVAYTNGDDQTLHAGGLIQLMGGVDVRFTPMYSVQINVGYHVDIASGNNGSLRFERFPAELLGYINVNPAIRLGLGVRYTTGAKVAGSGVLNSNQAGFGATMGSVVEAEYSATDNIGIRLRYVSEKYKPDTGGEEVNGGHVGLLVAYYF